MKTRPHWLSLAALALALIPASVAQGDRPAPPQRTFVQEMTLSRLGDASVRLRWQLPAVEYAVLQARLGRTRATRDKAGKLALVRVRPTEQDLEAYLNLSVLDVAVRGLKVAADDTKREIVATFTVDGLARATGATTWSAEVLDNARWYDLLGTHEAPLAATRDFEEGRGPAGALHFASSRPGNVVRGEVKLPAGATRAKLVRQGDGRWAVTYRLPAPVGSGPAGDDGDVSFKVEARHEVIPALHKVYGDPLWPTFWLARTTLTNPTGEALRSVRVRARVSTSAGQSAWGEWEELAAAVYPGGSAQFPLTPVLDAKALMLTSKENGKLHVEVEYTAGGKKVSRLRTVRLTVLGRNDAAYTNLPMAGHRTASFYHVYQEAPVMLAAFVTPHDPVVKDLKGLISSYIGGRATMGSDEGAERFAKALYDFFRANIAYSSPAGTEAEDGKLVQHVNYARNVLKNGTGTCIDLAVTYASVIEAAGVEAGVCLVPGHAFPYLVLPKSKKLLFVDVVCCRTGKMEGSDNFARALKSGSGHIAKDQPRLFANMVRLRKHVSAPELPRLDVVSPLRAWGRQSPPVVPEAAIGRIKIEHNALNSGKHLGVRFTIPVAVLNGKEQETELMLAVVRADGSPYLNADKQPQLARVRLRPASNSLFKDTVTVHYPYSCFSAPTDGVWYEFGLRVGVWAKTSQEEVAINPVTDRMVIQRTAEEKGKAGVARSVVFVTQGGVDKDGKSGVRLVIKDVQAGAAVPQGTITSADVLGGPSWTALKKPDGKAVNATATGVGYTTLWFSDEEMREAGSAQAKGLGLIINFFDGAKKEWLMPKAVVVNLKR